MGNDTPIISAILDATKGFTVEHMERRCPRENERTLSAGKAVMQLLEKPMQDDPEEKISMALIEDEEAFRELGFINGFRLAVQLMAECIGREA